MNLRRRIEALEKTNFAVLRRRRRIALTALERLGLQQTEPLISAFAARRVGGPLNQAESDAMQAYKEALSQECRSSGCSIVGLEDALDIHQVMSLAFAQGIDLADKHLLEPALAAREAGLAVTPEEAAALQKVDADWTRLCRLAGFSSSEPESFSER